MRNQIIWNKKEDIYDGWRWNAFMIDDVGKGHHIWANIWEKCDKIEISCLLDNQMIIRQREEGTLEEEVEKFESYLNWLEKDFVGLWWAHESKIVRGKIRYESDH